MFLSGLVVDAARAPVFFGSSAVLLAILFTCWHAVRLRLKRDGSPAGRRALLANLVLFLAQPLLLGFATAAGTTWSRFLVDLALSEVVVALVIPWFFALQEQALLLRGVDLADEARQPGGAL
jgi:rod shape-determining protein MreD